MINILILRVIIIFAGLLIFILLIISNLGSNSFMFAINGGNAD